MKDLFETRTKRIPLAEIVYKEKHPVRHETRAKKYAKMMRQGFQFPPIQVFGKRRKGDTFQVFDGHARVLAARILGKQRILADITLVDKTGLSILKKPGKRKT